MRKCLVIVLVVLLLLLIFGGCSTDDVVDSGREDVFQEIPLPPKEDTTENQDVDEEQIVSAINEGDIASAEAFGKVYIEDWANEEWTIYFNLKESKYNPEETARLANMYVDSREGWTPEYLAVNFIVVTVKYDSEFDHNLTFIEDGNCYIDLIFTREHVDADWEYWDSNGVVSVP